MNQTLLPHEFVENWRSMRLGLKQVLVLDQVQGKPQFEQVKEEVVNKLIDIDEFIRELANESDEVLRKELGLKKVKIRTHNDRKE